LSVETRPFDPETYEDEIDEEETLDEEGRARLKLKVENTIRWKEVMDKEGTIKKESNARLVRWSDGSYSLHLGSEIFDVYKQPLQVRFWRRFVKYKAIIFFRVIITTYSSDKVQVCKVKQSSGLS
jgi:hypothetical protein